MIKEIRNFLVLTFFIQVLIFINQNIEGHSSGLSGNSQFSFESINIDKVREFEIKDKSGHLKFEKIGRNWFLNENGGQVSSEKINKFFGNLKDISRFRSDTVSEPPNFSLMANGDNYSKMLTLTGTETLVLLFGKTDKNDRSYLRVEGEQKVYEINFVLDDLVVEPELWLELGSQENLGDSESK